jgi:hypothetical protein
MEEKGNVGEAISISFTSSNALVAAIEDYYYGSFNVEKVRHTPIPMNYITIDLCICCNIPKLL